MAKDTTESNHRYYHNKAQEDRKAETYEPPHTPALVPAYRESSRGNQNAYDTSWDSPDSDGDDAEE